MRKEFYKSRKGMTLVEVVLMSGLSTIVLAGVMGIYLWCGIQTSESSKKAWSQGIAMTSSERLTKLIRNAEEISDIDYAHGKWIELKFPGGEKRKIIYENNILKPRSGQMFVRNEDSSEIVVTRGMSGIQSSNGFSDPVFQMIGSNAVQVAYRIASVPNKNNPSDDAGYATSVRFAVCLRNAEIPD